MTSTKDAQPERQQRPRPTTLGGARPSTRGRALSLHQQQEKAFGTGDVNAGPNSTPVYGGKGAESSSQLGRMTSIPHAEGALLHDVEEHLARATRSLSRRSEHSQWHSDETIAPAPAPHLVSAESRQDGEKPGESEEIEYPDGGLRAWLVVLGCFILAATTMGGSLQWGVWGDYYKLYVFPDASVSVISLVGCLINSISGVVAFLAGRVGDRYGYKRVIALGILLAWVSNFVAAFSTNLAMTAVFQGVLQGISFGIALPLFISLPSHWFLKRRGLASGLAVSGSGIGGGILTIFLRLMLRSLGYKKTLIIYSCYTLVLNIIAWMLLKERFVSKPGERAKTTWFPAGIWRDKAFYGVLFSVAIAVFGYLSPYVYILTYTRETVTSMDPQALSTATPLIVMNICGGLGRLFAGMIADRLGPVNTFFISFFLGGFAQMVIWTFADSFGSIMAFSIIYGAVGGWFMALLAMVCAQLFGVKGLATITGFSVLCSAPGQLAGSSISGAVLDASGHQWYTVALYSGSVMIVGSLCALVARFDREKRIFARY